VIKKYISLIKGRKVITMTSLVQNKNINLVLLQNLYRFPSLGFLCFSRLN